MIESSLNLGNKADNEFLTAGDTLSSPMPVIKTYFGEVLTEKYSFETYVVGTSNQFAHASALAVASRPCTYNPLFIVGKTGLGKTHLLKAIGYRMAVNKPDIRICYCSTQKFIEEVIQAIRHDTRHKLLDTFLVNCDLLMIDDIQFLSGSRSTQDVFFHIFNGLFDASKQIVITSDRQPKEIADVEDRIINRFEWGMVADIEPPELETRVAILKNKAEAQGIELSDEVAYLIATYVKANIRELEGSLTKLAGHAAIYSVPISVELVKKVLKNYIGNDTHVVSMDEIIASVARFYSLKGTDLRGASRKGPIAKARQVVMYLGRDISKLSSAAIGQHLGDRDHTTVLHGYETVLKKMNEDSIFRAQVAQIEQSLLSKV